MYKLLAYVALLLISPQIFGGVFDPPPTDKSVELLGIIFGNTIGSIVLPGGSTNSALAEIMEKFNFIIVTAGLIVVSYAGVMSTINTAQEGTVMGKKWSAVWVPMRSIMGMLLMVPSPGTGYSMIQVTVMWIVLQGVGAADQLWTILLENLAIGNSASMGTKATDVKKEAAIKQNARNLVPQLLAHALCLEVYHLVAKLPQGDQPDARTDKIGNLAWQAQTNHTIGDDWIRNNGSKIKYYREQTLGATPSNSVMSGPTGPNNEEYPNTKGAHAKGYAKFGDSTDNSDYAQVCGKIEVVGTVWYNDYLNAQKDIDPVDRIPPSEAELTKAAQDIYDTKQQAINAMLATLQPLAEDIIKGDITPADPGATADYIKNAEEAYTTLMIGLTVPVETGDIDRNLIDLGIRDGWITAGSYYFTFNKMLISETFYDVINPVKDISVDACMDCDPRSLATCFASTSAGDSTCAAENFLKGFLEYDAELAQYLADQSELVIQNATSSGNHGYIEGEEGKSAGQMLGMVGNLNTMVLESMIHTLEGEGGEPLIAHAQFGAQIMLAAEIIWLYVAWLTMGMSIMSGLVPFVSLGAAVLIAFASTILSVLVPAIGITWTLGATLAIYLPFIPYMIFTVTALGWLLTVVESIIAAPLIALGLVIPAGDEMGKLSTALMLLANIFLRPMLMLFGFILAANVYKAAITLVDYGMSMVVAQVSAQTIFSFIVILIVYVSFILSLANTSFSLIYAVPDKILRWLGHSGESTNMEAVSKAEGMAKGGIGHMSGELGKSGIGMAGAVNKRAGEAADGAAKAVEANGDEATKGQKRLSQWLGGKTNK